MSRSKGFIVVLERKEDEEAGQVVKPHTIFVSCFSRPCQAISYLPIGGNERASQEVVTETQKGSPYGVSSVNHCRFSDSEIGAVLTLSDAKYH